MPALAAAAAAAFVARRSHRLSGDGPGPSLLPATVEALAEGYRSGPGVERRGFELLTAFATTIAAARGVAYAWDQERGIAPWRGDDSALGVHHYVPGAALSLVCGAGAMLAGQDRWRRRFSVGLGTGVALALDEAALMIEGDDVYWTYEWVALAQFAAATAGTLVLGGRFLRRWDQRRAALSADGSS